MSPPSDRIDEAWRTERPYLLAMATRTLHGRADAEDVIQEAFSRLARVDVAEIDDRDTPDRVGCLLGVQSFGSGRASR